MTSDLFSQTSATLYDAAAAQAAGVRRSHAVRILQDTSAGEIMKHIFTMFPSCIDGVLSGVPQGSILDSLFKRKLFKRFNRTKRRFILRSEQSLKTVQKV